MQSNPHQRAAAVVIGLGLMGCDIAAIFLAGGYKVTAVEASRERWPAQRERVRRSLKQIGGDLSAAPELVVVGQTGEVDWSQVALVIECVPENLDLTQRVFADLDERVP